MRLDGTDRNIHQLGYLPIGKSVDDAQLYASPHLWRQLPHFFVKYLSYFLIYRAILRAWRRINGVRHWLRGPIATLRIILINGSDDNFVLSYDLSHFASPDVTRYGE